MCSPSSINLTSTNITTGSTGGLTFTQWKDAATTLSLTNANAVNTSGIYYIKGTTAVGCSAVQPVSIIINPLPSVNITDPAPACVPATISLIDPAVTVGSATGLVFTYFTDAAATSVLTTPTAVAISGTYYIKGTLPSTGCSNTKPVTVNILTIPVIAVNNPAAVCEPASINLTAPAITSGSTTGVIFTYFTDAANTNPVTTPNAVTLSGTYYIKGSLANGCSASLPVLVTVNPLPNGVLQAPSVNYICDGLSLALNASNAFAYQWYVDQNIIANANAANYSATTSGTYTVRFTSKDGCVKDASNTIRLDVLLKPVLAFSINSRCIATPVNFSNSSTFASSGGISWLWDFGDGSSSNNLTATHTYAVPGNFTVVLTANNASCPNLTTQKAITYTIESPLPGIKYDTIEAIGGKPFVIYARTFGINYLWQPSTGLSNADIESPIANLSKDVLYTITITSPAGCTTTDSVYVKIATDGEIFVPQGFSPNGDGVNDKAYPILKGIRQLNYFKIYNRWGNLVFQTNDAVPQNGWDGKYSGKIQPAGTYTWIAEAIDGNGITIRRNGTIILIN